MYKARKIADNVWWVGAIDFNILDFHGYMTKRGTTYNAYLITGEKNIIIDTVKKPFFNEMLSRVSSVIKPDDVDYIISNHSELDHSGSLREAIDAFKPEAIYSSKNGKAALARHFHPELDVQAVENGGELKLGNNRLQFLETRMIHWPDSMFTYMPDQGILFSQDAFGMHLASTSLFADEVPEHILEYEAKKYYANIILHLSPMVARTLKMVKEKKLTVNVIAPDHGPVWRHSWPWIFKKYECWSSGDTTTCMHQNAQGVCSCESHEQGSGRYVLVCFDSMWGSTEKLARTIGEGAVSEGAFAKVLSLKSNHRSDIMTELMDANALAIGSPTLNNNMFPTVADLLTYMKGLRPTGKTAAAFGSFGWSGEAAGQVDSMLKDMKLEVISDPLKAQYVPDEDALKAAFDLGVKLAKK